MGSNFNILVPALGIIVALLWRIVLTSSNQSAPENNKSKTSGQGSKIFAEMCAECGADRFPTNLRKCGQCGSLNFTASPHYIICGYCKKPNGKDRETCFSCNDSLK